MNLVGFRTLIFNAIIVALGSIDATGLMNVLPAEKSGWVGAIIAGIGVVNMILRSLTTTPVAKSS